ncbi:MAG: hypothetical protein JSV50_07205 [Desulfobacteraceae bacterium]|nr:MAG: hypothetical protein JSV50_07205 [Desulfobacteraceae bacterium]
MKRIVFSSIVILTFIQFSLSIFLSPPSLAQEWKVRGKIRGVLRVVDLYDPSPSAAVNYAEGMVSY